MCLVLGTRDREKAADDEITNQLLLAAGPYPGGQKREGNPARSVPVSTHCRGSGRPTFHVILHLPRVTGTSIVPFDFFFSGLATPLHSVLACLSSTRCKKVSNK